MKRRGQALIETLVAVSVLTVSFLGLVSLVSRSLSMNRVVADNYTATYLAAEGIEVVKNILDANYLKGDWKQGISSGEFEIDYDDISIQGNNNRVLRFEPNTAIYSYDNGGDTRFKRTIVLAVGGEDIQVNSIVAWTTRGGGSFEINLEDRFFNWRKYAE